MNWVDWAVLIISIGFIALYGWWKTRRTETLSAYIKGDNSDRWFTIGLSVMATQASAITFLSTTGQGYMGGMGFVQFYFGLPLAVIIICAVFIPVYYKVNAYTAYEYLEQRFDLKTRLYTAGLFLISRGLAAGITIYAPAIVLSALFGWDLQITIVCIGVFVILYTLGGGTKAVAITQKQQMAVIFIGIFAGLYVTLDKLPENISFTQAVDIAGMAGKMNMVDLSLDPTTRYTLWSGLTGGLFLALSYFGTDQSQVQRYLSGKSVTESRLGLIFNGLLKIPMQVFILFCGVMVFVFYQYNPAPVHFNRQQAAQMEEASPGTVARYEDSLRILEGQKALFLKHPKEPEVYKGLLKEEERLRSSFRNALKEKLDLRKDKEKDTDYIYLTFILEHFPHGLIGLLIAVILCAAMSSTSSELSALSSTAMVDFYTRLSPAERSEKQKIRISRSLMVFWGILAIIFALTANMVENLIQLVNIVGSLFYGTILGIFLTAFLLKHVKGSSVFIAGIVAEIIVISVYFFTGLSFLWLNPIGCAAVMGIALLLEGRTKNHRPE